MGRSHGATATGFAMDAVEHACIVLGSESSPGFRGKLAEREESIPCSRILFHPRISQSLNIRTIDCGRQDQACILPVVARKWLDPSSLLKGSRLTSTSVSGPRLECGRASL